MKVFILAYAKSDWKYYLTSSSFMVMMIISASHKRPWQFSRFPQSIQTEMSAFTEDVNKPICKLFARAFSVSSDGTVNLETSFSKRFC